MKSIKLSKLTLAFCSILSSSAFAGCPYCATFYSLIPDTNGAALTDNRVYAGLKWTLNEGIKPVVDIASKKGAEAPLGSN